MIPVLTIKWSTYPVEREEYPGYLADKEGDHDGDDHLGQGQLGLGGHGWYEPRAITSFIRIAKPNFNFNYNFTLSYD